ncbi:MAG: PhoU domain-containing protein [Promethearchaeota archaeon]
METRKVQQTGGSSYIISLPKGWIVKHNIKKNELLGILSQPDGNLLITPKTEFDEFSKKKIFDIDEIQDLNYLFRLLIGAYIMGCSEMIISSGKKIEPKTREVIINFTQIVIGPEIIEETNNQIILKDLLNPKEMPFQKTIRRMFILAEDMHSDAIKALTKRDKKLAEDVIKRDNDIDRLHWLIGRQTNIVLRDIILAQKMGVSLEEAHFYHLMSRLLERIADHAVNLAQNVIPLIDFELNKKTIENISKASEISINLMNNSLDALLQKDIKKANENIESIKDLISACEKINYIYNHEDLHQSIALSYIIESIRRTGEYSSDISELIINYLIN